MSDLSSVENDLRAIEAINQRDVQFALANDSAKMMSQWIVLLPPAGPIMRGRSAIAEALWGVESPEIVEYVLDIQEVKVLDDHAFQWGTYPYGMRPRAGGETVRTAGKLMRILQRQPDGSWKMHRTISTVDPLTP
jgi:ketosteroid isomerase-like protein